MVQYSPFIYSENIVLMRGSPFIYRENISIVKYSPSLYRENISAQKYVIVSHPANFNFLCCPWLEVFLRFLQFVFLLLPCGVPPS